MSKARSDATPEFRVRTTSVSGTRSLGSWLAGVARPGDRVALMGPLGAGKTQVAKGFAAGLGVREVVNSPSFTLMAEYEGRLPLFHQDLYRLEDAEAAFAGGLLDERQDLGVTLSEWAERLGDAAGADRLEVRIRVLGEGPRGPGWVPAQDEVDQATDEPREVVLRASPGYERYLARARAWPGDHP